MEPGREVVAVGDLSEGRVGWVGGGWDEDEEEPRSGLT